MIPFEDATGESKATLLEDLGLSAPLALEILQLGLIKRFDASDLHPKGSGGQLQYIETCASMCHLLGRLGWTQVDEANVRMMVRPDGKVALSTASGNSHVGRAKSSPSKNSVGTKTEGMAVTNGLIQARLNLFGAADDPQSVQPRTDRVHWIMLYHWDKRLNELRSEVSRPVIGDHSSTTMTWEERLILPPLYPDAQPSGPFSPRSSHDPAGDYSESDIDIDIIRRDA